jgi:hypothetical protein
LTESDCDWIRKLSRKKYPHHYDFISTEGWFRDTVLKNPIKFLPIRTDSAFLIGFIDFLIWQPRDYTFSVALICADDSFHWEAVRLLRFSAQWAEERGCAAWFCGSDEDDVNLRAMCKRIGAKEIAPRFKMLLNR